MTNQFSQQLLCSRHTPLKVKMITKAEKSTGVGCPTRLPGATRSEQKKHLLSCIPFITYPPYKVGSYKLSDLSVSYHIQACYSIKKGGNKPVELLYYPDRRSKQNLLLEHFTKHFFKVYHSISNTFWCLEIPRYNISEEEYLLEMIKIIPSLCSQV